MKAFYSGYIEGYYGRELTWAQRLDLIPVLSKLGLNTYIYAPKEDEYHRSRWKSPYPQSWLKNFKSLTTGNLVWHALPAIDKKFYAK